MSEAEVKDILNAPDKRIKESEGLLTTLLRQIMIDANIGFNEYFVKMTAYLNDPRNNIPQTAHAKSSERGNMFKDFTNPNMSWRAFAKHLRLLAPVKVRFEIHALWPNRRETVTAIEIPLNEPVPYIQSNQYSLDLDDMSTDVEREQYSLDLEGEKGNAQ